MHPKLQRELTPAHEEILSILTKHGAMHPRVVESHIRERSSQQNYWGGKSRTSTMILDQLHDRGLLRIAKRKKGIRVYAIAEHETQLLSRRERYEALLVSTLQAMGATTRSFLIKEIGYHGYLAGKRAGRHDVLQALIDDQRVIVLADALNHPRPNSVRPDPVSCRSKPVVHRHLYYHRGECRLGPAWLKFLRY